MPEQKLNLLQFATGELTHGRDRADFRVQIRPSFLERRFGPIARPLGAARSNLSFVRVADPTKAPVFGVRTSHSLRRILDGSSSPYVR
jgi:hypothetical protein